MYTIACVPGRTAYQWAILNAEGQAVAHYDTEARADAVAVQLMIMAPSRASEQIRRESNG